MDIKNILGTENEKPLDSFPQNGGFTSIFRTIGCIGDSLASGEFESLDEEGNKGYHDYFEYSWGQFMAREAGTKVYNFSRGGMTAKEYCESFASHMDFWNPEKRCQAYVIALGVNDISAYGKDLGSISDIDINDYNNNKKTFVGYYAQIIQRLKANQPKARFFLMTCPVSSGRDSDRIEAEDLHQKLLYDMAELFDYTYVLDFRKYAPVYDDDFKKKFYLGGHLNAAGYLLTAKMVMSYIDYIIRNNMEDFAQVGFIGKDFHNVSAKW
ncbi:MAG: SGNH/GDSL hydrolase family protein [Clostridia bacterium]|nr:SGNH/GDSL hydrolase family protein [Clostridia bacterium]